MVLSKKELKKLDKMEEEFAFAVFAKVDDMRYEADMSQSEITKILVRNLKGYIKESFDKQYDVEDGSFD